MKIYRAKFDGKTTYYPSQEAAYKEVRRLAAQSYDPVVGETVETKSWPFTKKWFVDILNGVDWISETKVFYTAKAGLCGERPETLAPETDETSQDTPETGHSATQIPESGPAPELGTNDAPERSLGKIGPDTILLINPQEG